MNSFRAGCIVFTAWLIAGCSTPQIAAQSQEQHTCRNAGEWAEWDALLTKFPNDQDVISLYALRVGLCALIERGQIDPKTGVQLFERAHQTVIGKTIEEEAQRKRKSEL